MKNSLTLAALTLVVGLLAGYYFGKQQNKGLPFQPKEAISLSEARGSNNTFAKQFVSSQNVSKGTFSLPTSCMWESLYVEGETIKSILAQQNCNGLRAYPGIDKNGDFTIIFIGSKGEKLENIYTDALNAIVEDNNHPCKPICSLRL